MADKAGAPPAVALEAALKHSEKPPADTPIVRGYEFVQGQPVDYNRLLEAMATTGFQAANFGAAVKEVNRMLAWRLSIEPIKDDDLDREREPEVREGMRCKIFLGFTSNLMSSGVRESIRFLVQHQHVRRLNEGSQMTQIKGDDAFQVEVVVTTAGGIEEDLIKCLAPTFIGEFGLVGKELRAKGLNRIGNLLVPNDNYCRFEEWVMPILDAMLEEQKQQGVLWTPSKVIARLGKEIGSEESVLYWAWKNSIPVFCPALTDGSLGDMMYFHSFKNPGLVLDIISDIRAMNGEAVHAGLRKTGVIVLGGGLPKHHICNANMMRNGADFAVYINTAQEFDGSDSGARPDEAVSWGKIKGDAMPIKVHCDATLIFPLLVAQTFAKEQGRKHMNKGGGEAVVDLGS